MQCDGKTYCDFCGREVRFVILCFKGKTFHALENPLGVNVSREQSCWEISDFGQKSYDQVFGN